VQALCAARIGSAHLSLRGALEALKARGLQGFLEISRGAEADARRVASTASIRQAEQALETVRAARDEAVTDVEALLDEFLRFWETLAQGAAAGP
jgi:hypothetical protein